ncbi:MAG: hypothetical protein FJY80_04020 [Candidatus Aminicenantes bacterium]|nr:hypothetical protein [Candidatus Aminicenantes bacterium]
MKRIAIFFKISALTAIALLLSACLGIRVYDHVDDPEPYFDRAYREIDRLERSGRHVREVCLIAHDASDGELVRVEVPLWLVLPFAEAGVEAMEHDRHFGKWEDRYDFDPRALRHLEECGPGLLIDVRGENDRVLVWLR